MDGRTLQIRTADLTDLDELVGLSARTFYDAYHGMTPEDKLLFHVEETFTQENVVHWLTDEASTVYLATDGGETVGYAQLKVGVPTECIEDPAPMCLARIYLEKSATGRGYGATLMRKCLESAVEKGGELIWLSVWEENKRAIAFYRKFGFEIVGTHTFRYGGEMVIDLVMSRALI